MAKEFLTLLPYLKKYLPYYLAGLFFLLVTNAAQLAIPQLIRRALDHLDQRLEVVGLLALTALTVALGRIGWRFFIIGAARRIETDLRSRIFDHLTLLSDSFFSRHRTGDLMARATNDLDAVRMSCGMALVAFVDGVFLSLSITIILFTTHSSLGFYTILPLPVITLLILSLGGYVAKLFKQVQESFSDLSAQAQEAVTGARVIQAFVQQEVFTARFAGQNQEYLKRNLALTRLWGFFFPVIGLLSGLTALVLLWYGGSLVMDGSLTPGEFAGFMAYLGMLVWPMLGAGMTVTMIQRGAASLGRINEILTQDPDIRSPDQPIIPPPPYTLEVRNLTFSYPGRDVPVLKGLSFQLREGEKLGILGPTGVGKTTLLKLLPRLLDPPAGTVFLGGVDVKDWDLQELRKKFAMAPQGTFLFSDTIARNLSFASENLDKDRMVALGDITALSRDVEGFEAGWETLVGERGVTLSGGQKQRLSLARALAAPSPLLLLDDTLASVDLETEEKILGHLMKEAAGRGMILVSHRISTLKSCDRILVLREGLIVQEGTHQKLLAEEGPYGETAALQHQKPLNPGGPQ